MQGTEFAVRATKAFATAALLAGLALPLAARAETPAPLTATRRST